MEGDFNWTESRKDRLRELWLGTKKSASQIGREFGVSRNAIIGKARRMGVERGAWGRPWADSELADLLASYETREPVTRIAKRLRRTVLAVITRAHNLRASGELQVAHKPHATA